MQKAQPLVVRIYDEIGLTNDLQQIQRIKNALPLLVQQLNDSILQRQTSDFHKYASVFDWSFRNDAPYATQQLNRLGFQLLVKLVTVVPKQQVGKVLGLIFNLQNMIKFADPNLCKAVLDKLTDNLTTEDQTLSIMVCVKCGIYKPQIITSVVLTHANARYFTELLLLNLNKPGSKYFFQLILRFVISVYSKTDEFFYNNDLTVLVDVLLRTLEQPQTPKKIVDYCLQCFIGLSCCKGFQQLKKHRKEDLLYLAGAIQQKYPQFSQMTSQIIAGVIE